jgi:hypothetical protein
MNQLIDIKLGLWLKDSSKNMGLITMTRLVWL